MKVFFLVLLFLPAFSFAASNNSPNLLAPLLLDGESLGEVWVYVGKNDLVELETKSLLPTLEKAVQKESWENIRVSLARLKKVSAGDLSNLRIGFQFDKAALQLHLSVDDSIRARRNWDVRKEEDSQRAAVGPASFSGYLNAFAVQGFHYPKSQSRLPFRGRLNLVSNLQGWVFESGSNYTESTQFEWQREDTRLSRDFEKNMLRASAGDLQIFTSGFQNSRALGGLSLSRQFAIQPYLNIRPLNRTEVILKQPSMIEVYVNDGFVNRLNSPAGPVQVGDFPLFSGINKVDLKVTDDTGKVEWINLNVLFDAQLLGSGIQQFAYQVGAPSETVRNDRRYDDKNITATAFHRVGVSDHLTLGASFQMDRSVSLLGHEFVLLTRSGLVSGDLGLSRLASGLTTGAGRFRYRSLDYKIGFDKPIRGALEVEYKAKAFAALGQSSTVNDFSWKYDLSLSRPLSTGTTLGLGAQYLVNRLGKEDRRSARLDFTSELGPEWRTTLNYTAEREQKLGHRFQVLFSWIQAEGKFFGNLSYDYPSKATRLQASRNPSTVVDDFRATGGLEKSPSTLRGDLLFEYTHEKAQVRADHVSVRRSSGGVTDFTNDSTLTASSALAWAGGTVALSRPITDSFALISAKPRLREFPIPVNRLDQSAEAEVNYFGPAVLPNLTSYNEFPVVLDSAKVPVGYSLGREYYLARPTYRSGVKISVGGDSSAVVSGRLLKPGGAPISLGTGTVARLKGEEVATFFTNREGLFLLEGLPPGSYELKVDGQEYQPFVITLRETDFGFIKIAPHEFSRGAKP